MKTIKNLFEYFRNFISDLFNLEENADDIGFDDQCNEGSAE